MKTRIRRQTGGVTLNVLLVVILLAVAFGIYRAYSFYQSKVAPVVSGVSQVASALTQVASTASEAVTLNPYQFTRDPAAVEQSLQEAFRIAPPSGYVGALGMDVAILGQPQMRLTALVPRDVDPAGIFEGGRSEIRFNPGASTIFLAMMFSNADREQMRDAIARIAGGDGQSEPPREIYIDAGGRRVAALRGTVQSYGQTNTMVYTFLDDGRMFYAVGPSANFNEQALGEVLTSLVATHPANELLYQHPKPVVDSAPSNDPCGIPGLDNDFDVVVVSVTKGSKPLDMAIDQSGEDATQEDVVVGATPRPVVLVLAGQDPVVWNVGRTADARIAGVLAQGTYRQAVIGLPKSMRVTTYSNADGPNACRHFPAGQVGDPIYLAAQKRIRELFGRGFSTFLTTKASGPFIVGDASGEASYSADRDLASVKLPDGLLPGGQRGLDTLVRQQAIRPATDEEVARWLRGAAQRQGKPLEAYRRSMDWRLPKGGIYVVLKEFELPEGLAGADARTFILPAGAPRPGGPQGHCTFLQMEQFQCYGVGCS